MKLMSIYKAQISREEAKKKGLNFFFTGNYCKRNHRSKRYTSTGTCVDCRTIQAKNYRNTPKGRESRRSQLKKWRNSEKGKKFQTLPYQKLRRNLSNRIYISLKRQSGIKSKKTMELIGCKIDFLRNHLEKKFSATMNWKNYGKWHVDHIIPISKFNLNDPVEQKICFNYKNLQPMWGLENIIKSNK